MLFSELIETMLEEEMQPNISFLLEQKAISSEMGMGKRMDDLNSYIERNLIGMQAVIDSMPEGRKTDWATLNKLFLTQVLLQKDNQAGDCQ